MNKMIRRTKKDIARAIYNLKSDVLMKVTSSLDKKTEKQIIKMS